jgi:hypothetical protein
MSSVRGYDHHLFACHNTTAKALADTHAAKIIDVIKPMKEAGQTLQQIANALNKLGLPTSRNGSWYPTTVKNALARVLV